nr:Chain C, GP41 PEPTIDE [Human immunodeficiency virus 1]
ELDKYAS